MFSKISRKINLIFFPCSKWGRKLWGFFIFLMILFRLSQLSYVADDKLGRIALVAGFFGEIIFTGFTWVMTIGIVRSPFVFLGKIKTEEKKGF